MKRSQVEHVLRAAAAIAQEQSFVVVGSQAILLPFPHAPDELLVSMELDLYPALHREKDADFVRGLLRHRMIAPETLQQRLSLLDAARYPVQQLIEWARRRAAEAAA